MSGLLAFANISNLNVEPQPPSSLCLPMNPVLDTHPSIAPKYPRGLCEYNPVQSLSMLAAAKLPCLLGVPQHQNAGVTPQEHLADETVFVHGLCTLLSLPRFWYLRNK